MKPDKFLTSENILSMLTQFPQFGIMTFGVMLAMLLGGIDLSIVAIANLSSIVAAFIMTGGTGRRKAGDGDTGRYHCSGYRGGGCRSTLMEL